MAFFAPAKTPSPIVNLLSEAITKIVKMPETKTYFQSQGVEPMPMNPKELSQFLKLEIDKWAKVAKISGAKVD
jgi:tripartite-type tricarboxylate transporter receptor subunit TctC